MPDAPSELRQKPGVTENGHQATYAPDGTAAPVFDHGHAAETERRAAREISEALGYGRRRKESQHG